jgi:hypothetical protein
MNHDVLIAVLMLVTLPPLILLMAWSKSGIVDIHSDAFWERRLKIKQARIMAMVPHAVQLWLNLLEAVRDNKPKEEQEKCAKEVSDYIKLMAE